MALVGPSGAGKTSLFHGTQGVVPASGSVFLHGARIDQLTPAARAGAGLILVPQGRQIFPRLSVRDNFQVVADGLRLARDVVEAALNRFPVLADRANRPAGVLSGGEQQMLAVARAFMCAPSVILLDEPTLGLAPRIVGEVWAALEEMRREAQTTVIVAEPTTRLLPDWVDSGIIVINGSIRAVVPGSVLDMEYERHVTETVASSHVATSAQPRAVPPHRPGGVS